MENRIKTFESEIYSKPDESNMVKLIGMVKAKDLFDKLEKHLKDKGLLLDEYFIFTDSNFSNDAKLPDFQEFICSTNFGGSEGIYLDIDIKPYDEKHIHFATGKTLREDAEAFYRMSQIGAECSLMLNGRGRTIAKNEHSDDYRRSKLQISEMVRALEKESDVTIDYNVNPVDKDRKIRCYVKAAGERKVGFVLDNGGYGIPTDVRHIERARELADIALDAKHYADEYMESRPLYATGLKPGYKILAEHNDVVLAAIHNPLGINYVTWRYDFDRTGVNGGNYFSDNREAAQKDFAIRAGLNKFKFNETELELIHKGLEGWVKMYACLSYSEEETYNNILERIEDALPKVRENDKSIKPTSKVQPMEPIPPLNCMNPGRSR